jgi:hypothetical protein
MKEYILFCIQKNTKKTKQNKAKQKQKTQQQRFVCLFHGV